MGGGSQLKYREPAFCLYFGSLEGERRAWKEHVVSMEFCCHMSST
jgi:hypothetical protein